MYRLYRHVTRSSVVDTHYSSPVWEGNHYYWCPQTDHHLDSEPYTCTSLRLLEWLLWLSESRNSVWTWNEELRDTQYWAKRGALSQQVVSTVSHLSSASASITTPSFKNSTVATGKAVLSQMIMAVEPALRQPVSVSSIGLSGSVLRSVMSARTVQGRGDCRCSPNLLIYTTVWYNTKQTQDAALPQMRIQVYIYLTACDTHAQA